MKLSQFDFELPQEKIATELMPEIDGHIQWRDECKLMVLHKDTGEIEHRQFKDIIDYFGKGDRFVLNDTKVFPAKLYGKKEKTGADIMVFLLRELNREQRLWDVIVDPARKIRIGNKLYFGEDESMVAEVIDNTTSRGRTLRFLYDGPYDEFKAALFALGQTPVPEWVKQTPTARDAEEFQTIFATHEGAVSAPAAGLHFSRELLNRMILKDIEKTFITVHMGIGHFRTVDVEDLSKHRMDGERFIISEQAANEINRTKRSGKKICAVGVTVMRALETYVTTDHEVRANDSWTNKFIFPPYEFSVPDAIVSNFHLPESTMLMSVAAFGGYEKVMNAYESALQNDYRFGPYGDALLII
ncbi:MAG: tRNA preQ1(34) S-adenosylmethionine ribosyltransferase-isomerase QueA [Bacteroidales bacterium]|nr:tRNA preQ1(34) S-adenosylmethionine ribosyltransferase-isomerase QueA [Bacteroidales bacterium]